MSALPRRLRAAVLTPAVLTAALLAGCGAAPSPSAPGPAAEPVASAPSAGPDPCSLLTDQEASAVLGAVIERSGPTARSRGMACTWNADSGLVSVQVYQGRDFYAPDVQAPGGRQITGVADEAFVGDVIAGARSGETVVMVNAVGPGVHDSLEDVLRLAGGRLS